MGYAAQARGGEIRVPALPLPAVAGDEVIAAVAMAAIASSDGAVATDGTVAIGTSCGTEAGPA
ncbi:MAG: hypothetical protein J4G14_15130, partial [Dehalococcoidia bacterium]|nr:hypothetical protein [Dehalococcoidia bacterium]